METYVLDKTFLSIGSIGTGITVRLGLGTPGATSYRNRVKTLAGTVSPGSVMPIGISITGCSETGKQVIIRLLGIAKGKLQATQGTIMQGKFMYPALNGKLRGRYTQGGSAGLCAVGLCVYAEGGGSANSFIDVFVNPCAIT